MRTRPAAVLVAAAVVLTALSGCDKIALDPSGTPATEIRLLPEFTRVELQGVGEVTVVDGGECSVSVTTDTAYIDRVVTDVVNGTLVLNEDFKTGARDLEVVFVVTVPSIEAIALIGAGSFVVEDVDSESFEAVVTGAGDIVVSGSADTARVRLMGAGNIDTLDLDADAVEVHLAGAGDVLVRADSTLDVVVSGVGNVSYTGDPRVSSSVSGIGSVRAL